jgi:hypothetical protein
VSLFTPSPIYILHACTFTRSIRFAAARCYHFAAAVKQILIHADQQCCTALFSTKQAAAAAADDDDDCHSSYCCNCCCCVQRVKRKLSATFCSFSLLLAHSFSGDSTVSVYSSSPLAAITQMLCRYSLLVCVVHYSVKCMTKTISNAVYVAKNTLSTVTHSTYALVHSLLPFVVNT